MSTACSDAVVSGIYGYVARVEGRTGRSSSKDAFSALTRLES